MNSGSLCVLLTLLATSAAARALTQADLYRIEAVNHGLNARLQTSTPTASDRTGSVYAMDKAYRLLMSGYGPGEVRLAIVLDEKGEIHSVAEVIGTLKSKPVTIVLDQRLPWTASRSDLERTGYTWLAEFAR